MSAALVQTPPVITQDQILAHSVHYAASTCPIKDDIQQLAGCWKSGTGPVTKQEAGLLLWYHSQRDEDGCAEVLAAPGVVTTCLDVLDSAAVLQADKSTAGLLLSLCADDKGKEQVARSKASGANGRPCCQVLHAALDRAEEAPRHVVTILACLASCPTSLAVLLKALGGAVPWHTYTNLLEKSYKTAKDHATAIDTATFIQQVVSGREVLAVEAAAAGVLEALLAATAAHKSAAAVRAGASCLLALCQTAPELREKLGQLPGAIRIVVDLLGPPPALVTAWEQQQQLKQQPQPQSPPHPLPASPASGIAAAAGCDTDVLHPLGRTMPHNSSSTRAGVRGGGSTNGSSSNNQHVRISQRDSSTRWRGRATGNLGAVDGVEADGSAAGVLQEQQSSIKVRRKSLRILTAADGEAAAPIPAQTAATGMMGDASGSPTLRSKSLLGCAKGIMSNNTCGKASSCARSSSCSPFLRSPPLSSNATALKWAGPVPDATRTAVAGLLAQLVLLPHMAQAASDRLATPRLVTLLTQCMQHLTETSGKKGKAAGKKGSSKLTVTPETEQLLTNLCVCLEFLVAASNADCYRVAAAGCLPAVVQFATEARSTHLRRAAKAVVAQVVLVSEVQHYSQQAEVPEELAVLQDELQVPMKLTDAEVRQLLVEFPTGGALHSLDDVTARARC